MAARGTKLPKPAARQLSERKYYVRRKKRTAGRRFFKLLIRIAILALIIHFGGAFLKSNISMEKTREHGTKNTEKDPVVSFDPIDTSGISKDVPCEVIYSLETMATSNPEVITVLKNAAQYPTRLLESLANNPELLAFTLDYPEKKGTWNEKIDISDQYNPGQIPLLIQWDEDWGYAPYGDGMIALDGCGPTCLSMIAVGLTGDTSMNPKAVAAFSEGNGYLDAETGSTLWSLMTDGAGKLGLRSRELTLDEQQMIRELSQGHPIICSMRPGDFTTGGHFIVIYEYRDGKFLIKDPNSRSRSQKGWSYETLEPQIKNLWAFSR